MQLNNEAFWNTTKSWFLSSDKDLPKYSRKWLDNTFKYKSDISRIEMRLGMTSNLNLNNIRKAAEYLNVYIAASGLKLEVPTIFTYLKDSSNIKAAQVFEACIMELDRVKRRGEDGFWDSLFLQDKAAQHLADMAMNISKKIKRTKYEQALIDLSSRCRAKIFQRGVGTSFEGVRWDLISFYPVEVNKDLLTVVTVSTEEHTDTTDAFASATGDLATDIFIDKKKNPGLNAAAHAVNAAVVHSREKLYLTPYFGVLVHSDDIPLINNYKDTIIAKRDMKVLKDMIDYFPKFVSIITNNYHAQKKKLVASSQKWERQMMELDTSYNGMITLNREVLGKIDQYGNTIENLINFYNELL